MAEPSVEPIPGKSWQEVTAEAPVLLVGQVLDKRTQFLDLEFFREFTVVPMERANWIGSLVTVRVDQLLQNNTPLQLRQGERFTFVDDADGSAVINGVRVDTETPWLWPIERGQRYLISGRIMNDRFVATGMWNEPNPGGVMRGRYHLTDEKPTDPPRPDALRSASSKARRAAMA